MKSSKKGAMEMSIGTIVIIVLAMSMLILGMVLIKNIFSGATDIVDSSTQQISSEIAKIHGDEKRLVIYPSVDILEVKSGKTDGFAIRIKNLLENTDADQVVFSYNIVPDDFEECGLTEGQIFGWMKGESGQGIGIPSAGEYLEKVLLEIPEGAPLCSFKIRVAVLQNGKSYANEQMFIKIKG